MKVFINRLFISIIIVALLGNFYSKTNKHKKFYTSNSKYIINRKLIHMKPYQVIRYYSKPIFVNSYARSYTNLNTEPNNQNIYSCKDVCSSHYYNSINNKNLSILCPVGSRYMNVKDDGHLYCSCKLDSYIFKTKIENFCVINLTQCVLEKNCENIKNATNLDYKKLIIKK